MVAELTGQACLVGGRSRGNFLRLHASCLLKHLLVRRLAVGRWMRISSFIQVVQVRKEIWVDKTMKRTERRGKATGSHRRA